MAIQEDVHMQVWQGEVFESVREQSWLRWIDTVEEILGCTSDGDQSTDGYSADAFYQLWELGRSPRQAIVEVGQVAF